MAKLANMPKKPSGTTPVGEYTIECKEIEDGWGDDSHSSSADNLTMSIFETLTCGIYQADFDFGVVEGIMMLGADEGALERYCEEDHEELSSDDDDDDDSDSDDSDSVDDDDDSENNVDEKEEDWAFLFNRKGSSSTGITSAGNDKKRKAAAPPPVPVNTTTKRKVGRPPLLKKAKITDTDTTTTTKRRVGRPRKNVEAAAAGTAKKKTTRTLYHVRLKSRDTGTGEISPDANDGIIKFDGRGGCLSFKGEVSVDGIGDGVEFKGRKVADTAKTSNETWSDYSWDAYERERAGRW